jgi:hypothetical protein
MITHHLNNPPVCVTHIKFTPHPVEYGFNGSRAAIKFRNGWGASIITGHNAYSSEENPYEVAVLRGDHIDYSHGIDNNDDVFGHLNDADLLVLLSRIHALPATPEAE